jgi:phthalate 4,5-dioxygenase oxygenase subunit
MRAEENELLTRIGPGTPMGDLFRRYWIPAICADELPGPDCAPVRVRLLGEDLVSFRDTNDQIAFVEQHCPHRGASLFFGRNEEGGLRCVFHGWKFDVRGNCVDMPSEPPESSFKDKIHLKAYPGRDLGGLIWVYMGPPELMPGLPELEWALVPQEHRYLSRRLQECNYLQAMEGGIDSSHVSVLHRDLALVSDKTKGSVLRGKGKGRELVRADSAPKFEIRDTEYGLLIAARRNADENNYYWRITQWLLPWYTMIPAYGEGPLGGHAWVPIDDEHTWTYSINWHPARPLQREEVAEMRAGGGIHSPILPGTNTPKHNKANDYLIDRELQKSGLSYTGIRGIAVQDIAIQESMGPIQDRTREHLGSSDTAVIAARRRLIKAARELRDAGTPPGLDPASQRVRAISVVLPREASFEQATRDLLVSQPGISFVSA